MLTLHKVTPPDAKVIVPEAISRTFVPVGSKTEVTKTVSAAVLEGGVNFNNVFDLATEILPEEEDDPM